MTRRTGRAWITGSDGITGYCSRCGTLVTLDLDGAPAGDTCVHLAPAPRTSWPPVAYQGAPLPGMEARDV